MNRVLAAMAAMLCLVGQAHAADAKLTPEQQQLIAKFKAIATSLHPQFGDVSVPGASATLHLGKGYYFLPADEAKRVLTEAWGNPPASVTPVLGMVFPEGKSFVDDTWAAVVTFNDAGFVSDKQASPEEYDRLIRDAQAQEEEANAERTKAGFEPVHLVGWAQPPAYERSNHTVIWAREIQFGDQQDHTLNYDLRALGRHGVLSLNMVSTMSQLPLIRTAADNLRKTAAFNSGATFEEFDPKTDKATGYGIAGLVGAGLGIAAAKKVGLLAVAALFFKKAAVLVVAAVGGAMAWLRRRFGRKGVSP